MRFKPSPDQDRLLREEKLAASERAGQELARHARRLSGEIAAPWMRRKGSSLIVVQRSGGRTRVINTDYGAAIQEFGSAAKNTPAYAPLRRAVGAAGLRFKDAGPQ